MHQSHREDGQQDAQTEEAHRVAEIGHIGIQYQPDKPRLIMVNMVAFRYIISPPSFLLPKTFYCKFRIAQYCWFCKAFAYWETIFAGRDDLGTLFLTFCTGFTAAG